MSLDRVAARLRAAGSVFAEEEAALLLEAADASADPSIPLETLVSRRVGGEPLEVILGWVEFGGLRLRIEPGVFVPRQRSLALVEVAAAASPKRLLDLGCGSGALAAAVRRHVPGLDVWAIDVDPIAVACAQLNLPGVTAGQVVCGSWFEPLPSSVQGTFDVIVANAPYVPSDEVVLLPPEAREHEPLVALDGGADGLEHHRLLIAQSPRWLAPSGLVVIEVSQAQAVPARSLMEAAGMAVTVVVDEERGATVLVGARARADRWGGLGDCSDGYRS